jgi:hypothetical protein
MTVCESSICIPGTPKKFNGVASFQLNELVVLLRAQKSELPPKNVLQGVLARPLNRVPIQSCVYVRKDVFMGKFCPSDCHVSPI